MSEPGPWKLDIGRLNFPIGPFSNMVCDCNRKGTSESCSITHEVEAQVKEESSQKSVGGDRHRAVSDMGMSESRQPLENCFS